mgnify:CR=1 FL=1
MNMVKKPIELDAKEIPAFFNEIDWEWLLDFVSNTYGIGKEQKPDVKLSKTGHVEIGWQENLRDQCGVFKNTYRDVYLTVFSSGFSREVTYDEDMLNEKLKNWNPTREITYKDCNGVLSEPSFWMDISFRYEMFDGGFNYANLFNAVYEASIGWVIHTTNGKAYKQSK